MTTKPSDQPPPNAASVSLFRLSAGHWEGLREVLFVPGPAHLAHAVAPNEIANAVRDTVWWLDLMLRPEIAAPLHEAEWQGLRKGVAEDVGEDFVYAGADTPIGPLQVMGFSKRMVLRTRVVSPSSSDEPSQLFGAVLTTADGLFREALPKYPKAWGVTVLGEFVQAYSFEDVMTEGWKALSILTDGRGVAFQIKKLPENLEQCSQIDFMELDEPRPDPNWFEKPRRARDH